MPAMEGLTIWMARMAMNMPSTMDMKPTHSRHVSSGVTATGGATALSQADRGGGGAEQAAAFGIRTAGVDLGSDREPGAQPSRGAGIGGSDHALHPPPPHHPGGGARGGLPRPPAGQRARGPGPAGRP